MDYAWLIAYPGFGELWAFFGYAFSPQDLPSNSKHDVILPRRVKLFWQDSVGLDA
jgi:hypothetical protein